MQPFVSKIFDANTTVDVLVEQRKKNPTIFEGIKIDKAYMSDLIATHNSTFFDPKSVRIAIIEAMGKDPNLRERVDFAITVLSIVGPNPDLYKAKLERRTANGQESRKKLVQALILTANVLRTCLKDLVLRGTQLLACFPDKHISARHFINQKGALRQFFDPTKLPLIFQAPGLGPVIPDELLKAYEEFSEVFSRVISNQARGMDERIVKASFTWKIEIDVSKITIEESKVVPQGNETITAEDFKAVGSRPNGTSKNDTLPRTDINGKAIEETPQILAKPVATTTIWTNEADYRKFMDDKSAYSRLDALKAFRTFVPIDYVSSGRANEIKNLSETYTDFATFKAGIAKLYPLPGAYDPFA